MGGRRGARSPRSRSTWSSRRSSRTAKRCRPTGPSHGTIGYDFATRDDGLFVDRRIAGRVRSTSTSASPAGDPTSPISSTHEKKLIMRGRAGQRAAGAGPRLDRLAEQQPPHPRLHAEQPARRPARGDRLLPGLPHVPDGQRGRAIAGDDRAAIETRGRARRGGATRTSIRRCSTSSATRCCWTSRPIRPKPSGPIGSASP